jgi:hypothetical protein
MGEDGDAGTEISIHQSLNAAKSAFDAEMQIYHS